MAKDRRKVQHIHSSVPDKQPTPASLEVGEIAVNNSKDQEFLSIKNSDDKVVRFSSDEQLVTIMERKEVMPYKGYVRGETGPSSTSAETPTADSYGSYGITENDLLTNKSNIIVKLNQVAAGNTVKHDKVNGAKDVYNKLVNPTTDSGLTDGAGFFIDMSRYAMQDANPQFSSTTNTCRTTMSGTTIIRGLDGDCGSLLDIKVDSAKTDIETANTEITSATTVIGTNGTTISGNTTLVVSGTTTEIKNGDVTETNLANKVENTSGNSYNDVKLNYSGTTGGTTTEVKVGNVSESNSGTTTIDRKGNVSENNQNAYTLVTSGATTETKIGNVVENHSGTTTENKKGDVIENNLANKTENTTGNVNINTTGNTIENIGGKWDVTVTSSSGTEITSCSGFTVNTNDFKVKQCDGVSGSAEFDFCGGFDVNSDDINLTQCTEGQITITEKDTTINGENITINESGNTTINTTGNVVTNTSGTTTELKVGNVTENISGNSTVNINGNYSGNTTGTTTETKIGNVVENHSGTTTEIKNGDVTETNLANKTESTSGNSYNDVKLNYSGTTGGTTTIDRVGAVSVNNQSAYTLVTSGATIETKVLGVTEINLSDKRESTSGDYYSNINGSYTGNISGSSVNTVGGSHVETVGGNVVINVSGTTRENRVDNVVENNLANYTGNTSINYTLNTSGDTELNSTGITCINSQKTASLYGVLKTNIGLNCSETSSANTTNIYGSTIIEKANSADTNISTATTIIGTANTSANTATLSGNTLSVNEANSVSINTPNTTISGSNITINENETVINSCNKIELNSNDISFKQCSGGEGQIEFEYCGGFSAKTNDFEVFECTAGSGQANIKETSTLISGNTLSIDELTSVSAKTPTTYVSGTTLEVKETNVNASADTTNYSGNTLSVVENSSVSVKTPSTTVSGYSMDINECTRISASTNNLEVKECANGLGSAKVYMTNTDVSGSNFNVVETTSINLKSPEIVESGTTLTIDELTSVSAKTPTTYVSGTTLEVKETNVNVSANTTTYSGNSLTETMTGNETYNISGNLTEAITGNTNITVSGTTSISTEDGTTINTTNGNTNVNTTGNTCIHSTVDANFGGDSNTRIGANCNGVATSDNTYIFAETAVTINTPTTNITGNTNISGNTVVSGNTNISGNTTIGGTTYLSGATKIDSNLTVSGNTNISGNTTIGGTTYLSGDTYFKSKCTAITSNELGTAICEAFTRSVITIEEDHNPTDQSLAAVYTFYQNGETIKDASGNTVHIEVAKDKVLKSAVVVQNTSGEWVIRLTWITYDPETQQSTETTTDVPANELVKDIDFVNTNSITGAVWYDSTSGNQKISADTTVVIKNNGGSGTKTFSKSNGTNTLTSYTLSTQSGAYSATSGVSFDPFNTGATINIPTDASHITRKTLKVTHNGFTDTYDPGSSDEVWTLPHSALTINYGTNVNGRSSSTTYNTSGATTIDIPTCVSGIGRTLLSINYGDVHNASNSTYDPGSSCSGTGATATIPTCLENLTNWTNSCLQIQNDVCVSGDVTANNFYSTSDIRKKHKVLDIDYDSEIKISKVPLKSYILNDDHTERKLYGVIAQDVEAVGLNELVHTDEKGFKSVDYTSLLILRISHLEKMIGNLTDKLIQLEDKLNDN